MKTYAMKLVVFIFSLLLSFGLCAKQVNIFILSTGDIHESSRNLRAIQSYVDSQKRKHPDRVILVDVGDMLTQYPFPHYLKESDRKARDLASLQPKGAKMFEWAATMKYDAVSVGNHDFIVGVKDFQQMITTYNIPFISENISHPDLNIPKYKIIPLKLKTDHGNTVVLRVGIIAISDEDKKDYHSTSSTNKDNLTTYPVYNDTMKKVIETVDKNADIIVLLSHNKDSVDRKLLKDISDTKVCALIGGHSHKVLNEDNINGKILIKSGLYGSYVGNTMITWDTKKEKVISVTAQNISM